MHQNNALEAESPDIPFVPPTETFIDGLPSDDEDDMPKEEINRPNPQDLVHHPVRPRARSSAVAEETLDIEVDDNLSSRIVCPKPVQLYGLMSELQKEGNYATMKKYSLVYRQSDSGELVEVNTQEILEHYLEKLERPKLVLMKKTVY